MILKDEIDYDSKISNYNKCLKEQFCYRDDWNILDDSAMKLSISNGQFSE